MTARRDADLLVGEGRPIMAKPARAIGFVEEVRAVKIHQNDGVNPCPGPRTLLVLRAHVARELLEFLAGKRASFPLKRRDVLEGDLEHPVMRGRQHQREGGKRPKRPGDTDQEDQEPDQTPHRWAATLDDRRRVHPRSPSANARTSVRKRLTSTGEYHRTRRRPSREVLSVGSLLPVRRSSRQRLPSRYAQSSGMHPAMKIPAAPRASDLLIISGWSIPTHGSPITVVAGAPSSVPLSRRRTSRCVMSRQA